MTESELLMLQTELVASAWSIFFTWIGTTTAMVGAAYFVAGRITIGLVSAMLGLYTFFTAACATQLLRFWGRISAIAADLVELKETGIRLSNSATVAISNIDSRLVLNVMGPLMFIVFVGSTIYVIYCYKGGRTN